LITIEKIENFSQRRYKEILPNFKDTPKNLANDHYYVFRKVGHVRNFCNELLSIFYILKQLYIPDLRISDDYTEFQVFEKRIQEQGYDSELYDPDYK